MIISIVIVVVIIIIIVVIPLSYHYHYYFDYCMCIYTHIVVYTSHFATPPLSCNLHVQTFDHIVAL